VNANKLLRHWVGVAHGTIIMLAIAWGYEGKFDLNSVYVIVIPIAAILTFVLLVFTVMAIAEEMEK
jgi:hypothetical protein